MTTEETTLLAEYRNPPLAEVVCGIMFEPQRTLQAPHVGLLWEKFKDDYPSFQDLALLPPHREIFMEWDESASDEFAFSDVPLLPRTWFINSSENELVQLQYDRFLYNWRNEGTEGEYPSYNKIIGRFQRNLERFQSFLEEQDLEPVTPSGAELIYVNHIFQGKGWEDLGDLGDLFPHLSWQVGTLGFDIGIVDLTTTLNLPDNIGTLNIRVRNGLRTEDDLSLLVFQLSVQCFNEEDLPGNIIDWFGLAHTVIVQSFAKLTNEKVQQQVWGKIK